MLSEHLQRPRRECLVVFVGASLLAIAAHSQAGDSVQVPSGVHYKPADSAVNQAAKELLVKALAQKGDVSGEIFGSALTCGPGLWKVLQASADKSLQDTKPVIVLVNGVQIEAKGLITPEQQKDLWGLLVAHFPTLPTATIRKAHTDEIRYYWATIPFDIEEPLFSIDDGKEVIIANFSMEEGKPRLFWLDLVTDLQALTSGPPKVINLELLATMAESGDIPSMLQLGKGYFNGNGVPVDPEKSRYWWDRAANKGSLEAQMLLGTAYLSGMKFPKVGAAALKYLLMVAERPDPGPNEKGTVALAQLFVANLYAGGMGVEKSSEKKVDFLKRSVANGNAGAEFELGMLYNNGTDGLQVDTAQACQLFVKAADQGHVQSMHNAGFCYQNGTGVETNISTATHYYNEAAENGVTASMHNLGLLCGKSNQAGCAYFWLRVAQNSGSAEKKELIDAAKCRLTPVQVDEQEKAINAWMEAHKPKPTAAQ
jgi:TPR repeat protein